MSSCIGRVGGLAVALGIGAAATGGLGVAWAAPDDGSSTSNVDAAGSSQPPSAARSARAPRAARTTVDAGQESSVSELGPAGRRSADKLSSAGPSASRNNIAPAASVGKSPLPKAVTAAAISASAERVAVAAPVTPSPVATSPVAAAVAAPVAAQNLATPTVAPVMTPAPATAQAQPALGAALESAFNPLFGSNPAAPLESPLSWVVLAAARRPIGQGRAANPAAARAVAAAVTNSPPVISSVVLGTPNATTGAVTGTVKATDPNADSMTYKATTSNKGTVTITSAGVFTYTPTAAARHASAQVGATTAATTDTVTVTVTDSKGAPTTKAVTVPISPKNTVPTATKTVGSPNSSTGVVTGTVTGADSDKDALTYSGSTTTSKGTVVVTANTGAFTYTPTDTARHAAAKTGATTAATTDAFTLTVTDGYGGSVAVPITVTVSPKNTAPVAGTSTVGKPDTGTGVVAGTVSATDAESDPLSYSAPTSTAKGSVTLNASTGAFTYTPTATARDTAARTTDTTDTFTVTAIDGYGGSTAIPVSVAVSPLLAPNVVTFTFNYGTGSQYWNADSRATLQAAADAVAAYVVVNQPVNIVFDVTATSTTSRTLATATSDLTSTNAGFFGTVVQNKILTGIDPNGTKSDGLITVNFGMPWGFRDSVSNSQYDFKSTLMHEVTHTLGFISFVDAPGKNTRTNWTKYDSFIVNSSKTKVIGSTYKFNTTYNTNLTGGGGGLFFGGPNAIAAYGGLVPLYTPGTYAAGSSVTHLSDSAFKGMNLKLMNAMMTTGLGIRVLSAVELGVLKDLGYTVIPVQGGAALLILSFVFLRRRKV